MSGSRSFPGNARNDWSFWVNSGGLFEELPTCAFVVDANVLLRLYKVPTKEGRELLLRALGSVQDQLWVPHQVLIETATNRGGVVAKLFREINKTRGDVADAIGKIEFRCRRDFRHWDVWTDLGPELRRFSDEGRRLVEQIEALPDKHDLAELVSGAADPVWEEIRLLTEGRTFPDPGEDKRSLWIEDAMQREQDRRPPAWADRKKSGGRKFNDCVIWHEIREFAARESAPQTIVLVTLDVKDNGWVEHRNGRACGAHSMLVSELDEATGAAFHVIDPEELIAYGDSRRHELPVAQGLPRSGTDGGGAQPVRSHLFD